MARPALSVVIPCYNEAACLELLHARVAVVIALALVGEAGTDRIETIISGI